MILAPAVVERSISVVACINTVLVQDNTMKLTEAQLEDTVICLLGEQGYQHVLW